jgi:hypothetical protein
MPCPRNPAPDEFARRTTSSRRIEISSTCGRCAGSSAWLRAATTRPATLGADSSPAFSGQATVVRATLPFAGTIVLSDTGPLPQSGGALVQRAVHRLRYAWVRAVSGRFSRHIFGTLRSALLRSRATCLTVSHPPSEPVGHSCARRNGSHQRGWGSHCTSRSCSPSSVLISGSPVSSIA